MLIAAGIALVCLGVLVMLLQRFNINLGRLPGDMVLRSKGTTFYFPIVTCVLLSILASLVLWLLRRR
jgi:hypothetical protein